MTQSKINLVQTGKVVYLGSKARREDLVVKNSPVDSLVINHTGVVGNYHSRFIETDPAILKRFHITQEYADAMWAKGYRLFKNTQVYVRDLNLTALLKEHGVTIAPGDVSEQVLLEGVDLSVLHQGTIICIGEQVELEVIAPRTYCGRFILDLHFTPDQSRNQWEKMLRKMLSPENKVFTDRYTPLGVYTRVVRQGIVKLNDTVVVDPTRSKHFGAENLMIPKTTREINSSRHSWLTREQLTSMYPTISLDILNSYYD